MQRDDAYGKYEGGEDDLRARAARRVARYLRAHRRIEVCKRPGI